MTKILAVCALLSIENQCTEIIIRKGTKQVHHLSPGLFKIYIRDLSPQLDHNNCPKLMNQLISHLLWANDLILFELDPKTMQNNSILSIVCA